MTFTKAELEQMLRNARAANGRLEAEVEHLKSVAQTLRGKQKFARDQANTRGSILKDLMEKHFTWQFKE